eukprot:COSAG02_NODE_11_length_58539_cov_103.119473_3_plen_329_part_00
MCADAPRRAPRRPTADFALRPGRRVAWKKRLGTLPEVTRLRSAADISMERRTVLGLTATALGIGLVARKCYSASAAASPAAAGRTTQEPALVSAPALAGRTAHWVIRCTDLKPFLEFAQEVFGMKVIRHEENSEPCDIACNGRYNNAWSKTMVGYNDEAFAYCLEVAYNYGVYEYSPGNALLSIGIAVPNVKKALGSAHKLGYVVEGTTIVGPDGYKYEVSELASDRAEPFQFVKTVVADVAASKEFYTQTMGMMDLSTSAHVSVGYSGSQVPLILEQGVVDWQEYSGRHAISIPENDLLAIYSRVGGDVENDEKKESSASPSVVHHL